VIGRRRTAKNANARYHLTQFPAKTTVIPNAATTQSTVIPSQAEGSAAALPLQSPSTPQGALYQGATSLAPQNANKTSPGLTGR